MLVSPEQSNRARDAILGIGAWEVDSVFQSYITFAGGDSANNKLSADKPLEKGQPWGVREAVLEPLEALVMGGDGDVRPDTLWGVPSGGQAYAIELAEKRLAGSGLSVVRLKKEINRVGKKSYLPMTDRDAELLEKAKNTW